MTKRARYIWLGFFSLIGTILAVGAWDNSPGQDPDNQGGYAIALLFFLILLFIYVPVITRLIAARLRRRPASDAPPRNS